MKRLRALGNDQSCLLMHIIVKVNCGVGGRLLPSSDSSLFYFRVLSIHVALFFFLIHDIRITCGDGVGIRSWHCLVA